MKQICGAIKTGLLVAATAVLGLTQASFAQSPTWAPVTGANTPGYGGYVVLSQGTPDGALWIGTDGGGVHRSADSGASWTGMNTGLTNLRITDHLVFTGVTPYKMFAATYGGGVFKSVDGAANWTAINSGLGCSYANVLASVAPANTRLLTGTACQSSSGIYYNDGAGWTLANGLPTNVKVHNIAQVYSSSFGVDYLLAITDSGFYKSADSGVNWVALPSSPTGPNGALAQNLRVIFYTNAFAVQVTRLVTTVQGAGVFVSEDNGNTWTASNTGLPANPITFGLGWDGIDKVLYVSLDNAGTYKSTDRGATWALAFGSVDAIPAVRRIQRIDANLWVARTFAGPYTSTDGGTTWQKGGTGLPGGWTNNLRADNATPTPNIYASAADGVYKFNGVQWSKLPSLPNMVNGQVKNRGTTIYATTTNKGVYKFNATSNVWDAINNGLPTNLISRNPKYVGDGVNPNNAYLGLYGDGVYYTSDAGANWTARNTGLTGAALRVNSMDIFAGTNPYAYIATDDGVYKSTDGGLNWTLVFAPKNAAGAALPVGFISVDPKATTTVYVAVFNTDALGATLASNGVYKSTDAGATWTQLSGMAGKMVRDVEFVGANRDTLVAAAWDDGTAGGLFASTDSGATWSRVSDGLTTNKVNRVMTTSTGGYAATRGAGLFSFTDTSSTYDEWRYFGAWTNGTTINYGVSFGAKDVNQTLSGLSLTFGTQVVNGTYSTVGQNWNADIQLGSTVPPVSNVYTATTIPKTGSPVSSNFSIRAAGYNTAFPTNVQPSGGVNVTTTPVFTWIAPTGSTAYTYTVQLQNADAGYVQVWSSAYNLTATSLPYSGPALVPGTHYQVNVQSQEYDAATNTTYGASRAETFCYQCTGTGGGGTGTGTSLNVVKGWNLLGNGVEAPIDVTTAMNDPAKFTTVWKWLPGKPATATSAATLSGWAFYSPVLPDGGAAYAATKGYSFLTTINAGEGFWVNAASAFTGNLPAGTGVVSSSFKPAITNPAVAGGTHALGSGWSLVATGDNPTPAVFDAALSTLTSTPPAAGSTDVYTNLTTLWAWSTTANSGSGGWYFWAPALLNNQSLAGYIASKGYIDFGATGTLAPGMGFWVNMP